MCQMTSAVHTIQSLLICKLSLLWMSILYIDCVLDLMMHKISIFNPQDCLQPVNDLSPPEAASLTAQEPTLVTSLHWLHSSNDKDYLLTIYLYQGIRWVHDLTVSVWFNHQQMLQTWIWWNLLGYSTLVTNVYLYQFVGPLLIKRSRG